MIAPLLALAAVVPASQASTSQTVATPGVLQSVEVVRVDGGLALVDLVLDGAPFQAVLRPDSIRAHDFRVLVDRGDGGLVDVDAPSSTTWRGEVTDLEGSVVAASLEDDGIRALVVDPVREREWEVAPEAGTGLHRVTRTADLPGVDAVGQQLPAPSVPSLVGAGTAAAGTAIGKVCEVAADADYEYYQRNGASVEATVRDIERLFHRADLIFERDVDITLEITAIVVRTDVNDPYTLTTAGARLFQFANEWRNTQLFFVRRDVAQLFTNAQIGTTVATAYSDVVCTPGFGYGLVRGWFTSGLARRTAALAFALGTNFGAPVCDGNGDCRIMCSQLGGCDNDITRFGAPTIATIRANAALYPCLQDLQAPLPLPIFDPFPATQLDTALWVSEPNDAVSMDAIGEPSAPYSVELGAVGFVPGDRDRLVTNKLLLAGANAPVLRVSTQHRGVPAGGALDIEVKEQDGVWRSAARIVSDGVDQTTFSEQLIPLSAGALHDEAQIRFTADVIGADETWYIDDFDLRESCRDVANYCVAAANSVSFFGAQLQATPTSTTSIARNDLVLETIQCPTSSFGIYIYGDQQVQTPLGNGFLCVNGSPIYRAAVVQADALGTSVFALDQTNLPPGSVIQAGDTLNFQLWYRDSVGAGFNLSNGLSVSFCP